MASESRPVRQRASIRSIGITRHLHLRLRDRAGSTDRSASDLLRQALRCYVAGHISPPRKPQMSRLTVWITPAEWGAFIDKTKADGVTATSAVQAALSTLLESPEHRAIRKRGDSTNRS